MASSCCPVCYKVSASGTPPDFGGGGGHHDPVTTGAQQRFFELIQSFSLGQVGADGYDGAAGGEGQQKFPFPLEQFADLGMICCGECSKIMEGVCERHHQLQTAQLSLNRKLEKLKRILTETQRSSTRLTEHLEVTEKLKTGADMIEEVLESRASLIAICSGMVTCSFSKLDIVRLEFHEEPVGGAVNFSVGTVTKDTREETQLDLERSIKELYRKDDRQLGDPQISEAKKVELISKLEEARAQAIEEERRARRAAWTEEARKVILERRLFQERIIEFFPELVWRPIIKKLEDPKDKYTMSKMSSFWRKLLKEDRTTFIFNKVFEVLHANEYLPRNEILLFRSVSREWKRSADQWIQNFTIYPTLSNLQVRKLKPLISYDKVPMSFPVDVQRVNTFSKVSRRRRNLCPEWNPFFSRTLVLGCIIPQGIDENLFFWLEVESILFLWGREVWTVDVQFSSPNHFNSVRAYDQIIRLLRLLPNLRHLGLLSPDPMDRDDELERSLLRDRMRKNPPPEMPHLRSFVASKIPSAMTKLMLENFGPSLDTIIAHCASGDICETAQLLNVKQMSLELSHVTPHEMNWPSIEYLDLKYVTGDCVATKIPNLFLNLGAVGGSLLKLNLILLNGNNPQPGVKLEPAAIKMLSLELPCLEEFSLTMGLGLGNLETIDFILPMKKLRSLNLTYVKHLKVGKKVVKKPGDKQQRENPEPEPGSSKEQGATSSEGEGVIIQFWEYTNRLYDSNIWILFPELRKVHITTFLVETTRSGTDPVTGLGIFTSEDIIKEKVYTRRGPEALLHEA